MVCQKQVEVDVTKRLVLVLLNFSISNVKITDHIIFNTK